MPNGCLEICLASITKATLKQYNSGLKLWWEFCCTKNLDPFTATSVVNVLEFLTTQFNRGVSYSSLNTYRSAISQIAGPDLSQDFRMQRFFKGAYMLRPSVPKYENTWDPFVVLSYLKNLQNLDDNLELLTQKLATLLALATGQRLQTLALIEVPYIYKSDDKLEITIRQRIKTSGRNKSQPMLVIPFFNSEPNICVGRTLLLYLEKTQAIRGTETFLFLTTKKPFRKASVQSLSRWIKNILIKSGIDVNKFTPYSTRHASTSAANRKGLNFDSIRQAAGWSIKSKMFATVYNRPLLSSKTFAEMVFTP